MLSKSIVKMSCVILGLSLTACAAPSGTDSAQQSSAEANTAQVAATDPTAAASSPVVAANFGRGGFSWSRSGGMMYRYTAFERNGEVVICGAFTGRGSTNSRKLSREVMRQATVTADGRTILRNLRFFTEASNSNWSSALVGVQTSCRATGQPADTVQLDTIRIKIRSGNYRVER